LELSKFDVCMPNIFSDFETHLLWSTRQNIKSHFIHFNGSRILLLMIVNVSHIDPNSTRTIILLSFYYLIVFSQCFLEHSACL
jgi:hypothetical protein